MSLDPSKVLIRYETASGGNGFGGSYVVQNAVVRKTVILCRGDSITVEASYDPCFLILFQRTDEKEREQSSNCNLVAESGLLITKSPITLVK